MFVQHDERYLSLRYLGYHVSAVQSTLYSQFGGVHLLSVGDGISLS